MGAGLSSSACARTGASCRSRSASAPCLPRTGVLVTERHTGHQREEAGRSRFRDPAGVGAGRHGDRRPGRPDRARQRPGRAAVRLHARRAPGPADRAADPRALPRGTRASPRRIRRPAARAADGGRPGALRAAEGRHGVPGRDQPEPDGDRGRALDHQRDPRRDRPCQARRGAAGPPGPPGGAGGRAHRPAHRGQRGATAGDRRASAGGGPAPRAGQPPRARAAGDPGAQPDPGGQGAVHPERRREPARRHRHPGPGAAGRGVEPGPRRALGRPARRDPGPAVLRRLPELPRGRPGALPGPALRGDGGSLRPGPVRARVAR